MEIPMGFRGGPWERAGMADPIEDAAAATEATIARAAASRIQGYKIGDREVQYVPIEQLLDARERLQRLRPGGQGHAHNVIEVLDA